MIDTIANRRVRFAALILALALCLAFFGLAQWQTAFVNNDFNKAEAAAESVYLGGIPVGIVVKSEGLTVVDYVEVITQKDAVCPARDAGIQRGDTLLAINGKPLKEVRDISDLVSSSPDKVNIDIARGGDRLVAEVTPAKDIVSGEYKLGILVKNDIAGVGTVTFVKEDGRVCTLGHCISDPGADNAYKYQNGYFYKCKILGSVKGKENEAGMLKGVFDRNSESIGIADLNNDFGVYGVSTGSQLTASRPRIFTGSRNEVQPGKAYIYTTIEGFTPKKYEIEIVKAEAQNSPSTKGMVIRVTDKELLGITGGIVQGMSGSPIVQNGKLVGAVTHVFLNDAAYGYGIYAEWLLQQ